MKIYLAWLSTAFGFWMMGGLSGWGWYLGLLVAVPGIVLLFRIVKTKIAT